MNSLRPLTALWAEAARHVKHRYLRFHARRVNPTAPADVLLPLALGMADTGRT